MFNNQSTLRGIVFTVLLKVLFAAPLLSQTDTVHNVKALALLKYLKELPDRAEARCLSGQAIGANANPVNEKDNYQNYVNKLGTQTGHRPVVLEYAIFKNNGNRMSVSEQQTQREQILARCNEGHLIYLSMRPGRPIGSSGQINDANTMVQPDGIHYQAWRSQLEYAAAFIAPLEQAGVVVVFEVFNEFNGSWNWFGNMTPENFKKFWKYTYDFFAKENNFKNMLYALEYSANTTNNENIPAVQYYPGDEYVDIIGFDFYHDDPKGEYVDVYNEMLAFGKPVAMAEFGPNNRKFRADNGLPDGQQVNFRWDNRIQLDFTKTYYPKCCFFIRWQQDWAIVNQNYANEFMDDPWWAHLDRFKQDMATGIDQHKTSNAYTVYPNPASKFITLKDHGNMNKAENYQLFDISGRLLLEDKTTPGETLIDVGHLTPGIYCLNVTGDQQGHELIMFTKRNTLF